MPICRSPLAPNWREVELVLDPERFSTLPPLDVEEFCDELLRLSWYEKDGSNSKRNFSWSFFSMSKLTVKVLRSEMLVLLLPVSRSVPSAWNEVRFETLRRSFWLYR